MIQQIQKDNQSIREKYLYHGQAYGNQQSFLIKTLGVQHKLRDSSFSFKTQISIGVSRYMRSKAMDDVISSYDKQAAKLNQELAQVFAKQLFEQKPAMAKKVEEAIARGVDIDTVKKQISEGLVQLEIVGRTLAEANLSSGDKHVLLGTGILAGSIYMLVKEHKEFRKIVTFVNQMRVKLEDAQKKYREFMVLTTSLNQHAESSIEGMRSFQNGMKEAGANMLALYNESMASSQGTNGIHSHRVIDFIDNKIRGKKSPNTVQLPDQFSARVSKINNGLNLGISSLGTMAGSLDAIIGTTNRMANLLGVKLSPGLQKTLKDVQNVASIVSMGSKAFELFQTGGASAALSVLGGGSPFGGDQSAMQLGEINKKLDQVLQNQKLMMEAQIETMNMIKNLAVMIDQYHESEMGMLDEIRNYLIVGLEIQKANLVNKEIQSCEQLINYQLSSVWEGYDARKAPYHNVGHLELLRARFNDRLTGMAGIRSLVNSSGEDEYRNCQNAFIKSFGSYIGRENPLMGIYDSDEQNDLIAFTNRVYRPVLTALRHFSHSKNLNQSALHHPIVKISDLHLKAALLPTANGLDVLPLSNQIYSLDHLISVKNTERYVTSLLLLYPIFDLRKTDWDLPVSELVKTYLNRTDTNVPHAIKSAYYLSGALKVIQSAIAQEALLVGEPIIPGLYQEFRHQLLARTDCSKITAYTEGELDESFTCALRSNVHLMKNYLKYSLMMNNLTSPALRGQYQAALDTGNTVELSRLLNVDVEIKLSGITKRPAISISAMKGLGRPAPKVELELPTVNELMDDTVEYSENMQQLLTMQDYILLELEKVHPVSRDLNADLMVQMWSYQ